MTLPDAIALRLDALRVRNYSPRTVINQACHLRHLSRFLAQCAPPVRDLETVTGDRLTEFQSWLYHQPTPGGAARGVADQNRILSGVRGLFAFLKSGAWLTHDPAAALAQAREPRTLPRHVLTPREARRILEAVDAGTATGQRDRTILEVFYATGLRAAELRALRVADVNLEDGLLRIEHGKGGHDRVAPLSRIAARCLETYLNAIRPELARGRKTDRLFLTAHGKPLDKNALGEMVVRTARAAKIKQRVTCHLWRHTCATHLLQNRANLRHVQEILGHRSLATTERYLHLTITDLKAAHRRCHPREKGVE